MANEGSPLSNINVNHVTERLQQIREGQVKLFVQNGAAEWVPAQAASEQALPFSEQSSGGITISTATITQLSPDLPVDAAILQASNNNAGLIYFGGSSFTRDTAFELPPGATVKVAVANLNQIYVLADSVGDKMKYLAGVR
jgi:hypothetical protein